MLKTARRRPGRRQPKDLRVPAMRGRSSPTSPGSMDPGAELIEGHLVASERGALGGIPLDERRAENALQVTLDQNGVSPAIADDVHPALFATHDEQTGILGIRRLIGGKKQH